MLSYAAVADNPVLLRAFTGLDEPEFEALAQAFQAAWEAYVTEHYINRPERQRNYGGGRKPTLRTTEDKLLFILFYFKTYPLQQVLAFLFGMSQGQACTWIEILSEVLKRALERMHHLPERDPKQVAQTLEQDPEDTFAIDGTERRRQRPKDPEVQKTYYSGKKKAHTVKNNLIVTLEDRQVKYLSGTYEGKKHDKKICDEEEPTFPEGVTLYKDTGFQGYEPAGVNTKQPKKKPRGGELSDEEKAQNALISRIRIVVEHVISGIKRCRIVKDVFRNTKAGFADLVMMIACGLHNLRTAYRAQA